MSVNNNIFTPLLIAPVLLFSVSVTATPMTFEVSANANSSSGGSGLQTGLFFVAGESIVGSVDRDDLWSAGAIPRWSNADGLTRELIATGTDESGQPTGTVIGAAFGSWTQNGLTAPYGSLVGNVSDSYFVLGTDFDLLAPKTGELSLYYWDSNAGDNLESVLVTIGSGVDGRSNGDGGGGSDASEIPAPGVLLLVSLGLVGLLRTKKAV